jgi:hypothetical protein
VQAASVRGHRVALPSESEACASCLALWWAPCLSPSLGGSRHREGRARSKQQGPKCVAFKDFLAGVTRVALAQAARRITDV